MEVILSEDEYFDAFLECVIGEMVLIIPEDLPVRIELNSGMTGVSLDDGFVKEGNLIFSPAADRSDQDMVIVVNLPMGSLKLKNQ
jgi:hypothetical protein